MPNPCPIPAAVAPTSGAELQASAQAGPNSISAAMQDLSLYNTSPASVPIPAAATLSAVTIPVSIPTVPGPVAVPPAIFVPAGMPSSISVPILEVVPAPGSQVFPTALQHQTMQQAPASISAPVLFVTPVPIPDDNELGAAEADPIQTKTKTKLKSKCNKVAEEVVAVEDSGGHKTQSKRSAANK